MTIYKYNNNIKFNEIFFALQPIFPTTGISKLIYKDNIVHLCFFSSDYSFSPKIEILGVINRNLRMLCYVDGFSAFIDNSKDFNLLPQ